MKKNKLLILSIIFFILIFLSIWFLDETGRIGDGFIIFFGFPIALAIMIIYLILVIENIIILKKDRRIVNIISLIILLSIVFVSFSFPFRKVKTKLEFNLYEKDRYQVIDMVKNKKIKPDEFGNAKLPKKYKRTSNDDCIYIYQNDEEVEIGFWISRGMMSGSEELIYSTGGEELIRKNETGHPIVSIEKIKENWYYVITDY